MQRVANLHFTISAWITNAVAIRVTRLKVTGPWLWRSKTFTWGSPCCRCMWSGALNGFRVWKRMVRHQMYLYIFSSLSICFTCQRCFMGPQLQEKNQSFALLMLDTWKLFYQPCIIFCQVGTPVFHALTIAVRILAADAALCLVLNSLHVGESALT